MTIAVDWDIKQQNKQIIKMENKIRNIFHLFGEFFPSKLVENWLIFGSRLNLGKSLYYKV